MDGEEIELRATDYWFKVVNMLQQNWALIEDMGQDESCVVYFIHDQSGVFDQIGFPSVEDAHAGLRRNGFNRLEDDSRAVEIIAPPSPPFRHAQHPNGPIYSSGRHWL